MSDGLHRSLKMRRGWKKVAEFADKRAFALEEVSEAVISALGQDWRADVPEPVARGICEVFSDQQNTLFSDHKVEPLKALRRMAMGHGLGQVLIDCAIRQAVSGASGPEAAVQAATEALSIQSASCARQVEEHYYRECSVARASDVRNRIEEAIGNALLEELAGQLLKLDSQPAPRAPSKQTGLDDGVRL